MQPRAVGGLRPSPLRDAALGQSREVAELDTVVDIDNLLQRNVAVLSPSDLTSSGGNSKNQSFPFHQPSADTLSSQPLLLREGWQSYSANDEARVTFSPQHSLREDDRTSFLLHISFIIVRYLRAGFRWIAKFVALGLYSLFLLPGFVQIGWYYFFSPHVQRNIAYGEGRRNRLDLYIPEKPNKQKPAVAFVTGGAWIIGYKAWGSLLAQELVERDVIVACIDYRNFPQTGVSGMVEDIAKGISFFCQNIHKYGGDPDRLYLAGQSAGAHLAACALIEQAKKEASEEIPTLAWRASQFKAFLGISGG
ncbi:hypothetical protein O6H91_Y284900 [Diphasiastrum complanatum]|nr:hypothetical protein O6H91_Y284900 [Diphasiastrum complanatum]